MCCGVDVTIFGHLACCSSAYHMITFLIFMLFPGARAISICLPPSLLLSVVATKTLSLNNLKEGKVYRNSWFQRSQSMVCWTYHHGPKARNHVMARTWWGTNAAHFMAAGKWWGWVVPFKGFKNPFKSSCWSLFLPLHITTSHNSIIQGPNLQPRSLWGHLKLDPCTCWINGRRNKTLSLHLENHSIVCKTTQLDHITLCEPLSLIREIIRIWVAQHCDYAPFNKCAKVGRLSYNFSLRALWKSLLFF